MLSDPLHVLLLGWNDAPRTGEAAVPDLSPLVHTLAPHASLSVVIPHQLRTPIQAADVARLTSLADLTPEEARAPRPRPDQRPGAWRRFPAAPYVGSSSPETALASGAGGSWAVPAAPYQGATPTPSGTASSHRPLPAETTMQAGPAATAAALAPEPEAAPAFSAEEEMLLNRDEFAEQDAEPAPHEATALPEPEHLLTPSVPPAQATLHEALAALGVDLPPEADLNFQVIQYARFATRRALLEDFSVIYATDWPTWLAALEIRQQTGRPLVLHVHSLAQERASAADRGWALELERLAMRRADLVLAASDDVAHLLRVRYQLPPARLHLVHPTDTEAINTLFQQFDNRLPGRQFVVPFFPPSA